MLGKKKLLWFSGTQVEQIELIKLRTGDTYSGIVRKALSEYLKKLI